MRLLVCLALSTLAAAAQAQDAPQRIVSMNVCTDQLLMLLVERERIAGVSWLATDPESSAMAEQARGLPITHGVAEEVIARDPDLVVAGTYTTRVTVQLLTRLGLPVVELAPESSFADIRGNLRILGAAVGETARAEALIAAFDRDLAALSVDAGDAPRKVFASYGVGGWTVGAGTLHADVAHAAGYDTLGERLGFAGSRNVSLEQLIVSSPDLIAVVDRIVGPPALATDALDHPALRRLMTQQSSVDVPDALWVCGAPFTLEAVRLIAAAQDQGDHAIPPPPGGEGVGGGGPKSKRGPFPDKPANIPPKQADSSQSEPSTPPPPTPYPLPARGRGRETP